MKSNLLKKDELDFLQTISTNNWKLKGGIIRPRVQNLIDRGYCKTSKERLGPLGVYTGDVFITLTEAGRSFFDK